MSVKVRERNGAHWVYAESHGRRKAKRVGPGKPGKALADQLAKQWSAWLTLGNDDKIFTQKVAPVSTGAGPRLRDALLEWIERREKQGDLRGASPSSYRSACKTWVLPHALPDGHVLGDLPVAQISREHLGAVITKIKAAGRSRSTVEHVRNAVRGFYREQVETKRLATSPAADLGFFVGKLKRRKTVEFFTLAECATILKAAEDTRMAAFTATALGTGCRWGELAALTRDDLDLKGRRVHVTKSWSPKSGKVETTKTDAGRFIPLSARLVEVLKDWCEVRAAEGWGPDALLFPDDDGRHLRHVYRVWAALLKRAGVRHLKFHCTRHSFATHALKSGIRPELVQKWLGHTNLTMTLNVYGHFVPDSVGDAADAEKLGALLK